MYHATTCAPGEVVFAKPYVVICHPAQEVRLRPVGQACTKSSQATAFLKAKVTGDGDATFAHFSCRVIIVPEQEAIVRVKTETVRIVFDICPEIIV